MRREHDVGRRSDRSYLCLLAIYAIHALLLNVFIRPQFEISSRVTINPSYVRVTYEKLRSLDKNSSQSLMSDTDVSVRHEQTVSSIKNSTRFVDRRDTDEDDYTENYTAESSAKVLLLQSKSSRATIHLLTTPKTSGVSRVTFDTLSTARRIFGNLSPAAWGILSGCLVFLLTFTENDYD